MRLAGFLTLIAGCAFSQPYDLLLRHGRVIDPANGIDARLDVAVSGGRIALVQADIPPAQARRVIEVSGFYVVPGLIDLHAACFRLRGVPDAR